MKITFTIKLSPQSKGEMVDGREYREFRERWEQFVQAQQAIGLMPHNVDTRWLLDSGRWE